MASAATAGPRRCRDSSAGSRGAPRDPRLEPQLAAAGRAQVADEAVKAGRDERLAEAVQAQGLDMILQVGLARLGVAPREGAELRGRRSAARAGTGRTRGHPGAPSSSVGALVQGDGFGPCRPAQLQMVLQVARRRPAARAAARSRAACSAAPGPMPDSCSRCGEPMAPAARYLAARRRTLDAAPPQHQAHHALAVERSRSPGAVTRQGWGGSSAGRRNPLAVFQRTPSPG